ncbi:N-acetylmuramoyl-L-alanine amidase [Oceanobacillus sp. Castelsardo]|uniref:N-acetylmuramoyl-L-alanine amidase n=1 Tax=Oceanobacillus sp. Castelsardo TaxID=1851204 RepID=UPI0008381862|nr:N-acetylmuramoyl-L-alanine amidase [Oceanobacillus sp. Castelsardo]
MSFKVAVGAGHGGAGSTPGKRSPEGEYEWNFSNKVVTSFINELKKYNGVEIIRLDDANRSDGLVDVSLRNRTSRANRWGADVYISVHHNAFSGKWGDWTGTETFYYQGSSESKKLAEVVHQAMLKAYGLYDRGLKKGNHLYEINATNMPAVLTEGGFVDSRIDIKKLRDDKVLEQAGKNVAEAVAKYAGLKKNNKNSDSGKGSSSSEPTKVTKPKETEGKSQVVSSAGSERAGDIANIQATLNKRYNTKIRVDNKYGPETLRALVIGYQTELNKQFNAGLKVDGIFGPNTKRKTVIVDRGAKGNLTWIIQATLSSKGYDTNGVDGIYGSGTVNAVKKFQRSARLQADGIFGKNTAEALFT